MSRAALGTAHRGSDRGDREEVRVGEFKCPGQARRALCGAAAAGAAPGVQRLLSFAPSSPRSVQLGW